MEKKVQIIALLFLVAFFGACGIDNYEPPESQLQGKLVYQGEPIHVQSNSVTFELWQSGFGKMTPIEVTVDQDGSYSAMLFDGDYKLIIPGGQGPFISSANTDSLSVQLRGDMTFDIEVTPFYAIQNPEFSIADSTVTATCALEKVITDENAKSIASIELYISKTQFVNRGTSISSQTINGGDIADLNNITLSAQIPELIPSQSYVFARIGIKMNNVEDMLFSAVKKLQLN